MRLEMAGGWWRWNRSPAFAFSLPLATHISEEMIMNNIVWLVGAIVIVLAILSFFGLR